jgi:hypothetical protein
MTDQWILDEMNSTNQGWGSAHAALPSIIDANTNGVYYGVEVGIAYGSMSMALLAHFPTLNMVGVDPFEPYSTTDHMSKNQNDMDKLCEFTTERVKSSFPNRFSLMRLPSIKAADQFANGSLDFVFIDACHEYEPVKADIEAWASKVRSGGILCGHDYGREWVGVKAAVDEFFTSRNQDFFIDVGSMIWASVMP